jgi:hypothetical protein
MIVVKIQGGIGNQLFQYAIARSLATLIKTEFRLHVPKNTLKRVGIHKKIFYWVLKMFPVKNTRINEIIYFSKYPRDFQLNHFGISPDLIINDVEFQNLQEQFNFNWIFDKQFGFDPNILNLANNVYLDGFWQSEKYFSNYKQLISDELRIKPEFKSNIINKIFNTNSVAIHIRRGDYHLVKENESFGILNMEYYQKAMNFISENDDNPYFFVFSDDENWVKSSFLKKVKTENIELVSKNARHKTFIDLCLMSQCKHQIVANSSYSWWGAWLNSNPCKIVICPKRPFIGSFFNNYDDYYPENWIRIDNETF